MNEFETTEKEWVETNWFEWTEAEWDEHAQYLRDGVFTVREFGTPSSVGGTCLYPETCLAWANGLGTSSYLVGNTLVNNPFIGTLSFPYERDFQVPAGYYAVYTKISLDWYRGLEVPNEILNTYSNFCFIKVTEGGTAEVVCKGSSTPTCSVVSGEVWHESLPGEELEYNEVPSAWK